MTTATSAASVFSIEADAPSRWRERRATAASVLLHAGALLAAWTWSARPIEAPQVPPPVELIRLAPEAPPELVPPKPEPEPPKDKPDKPLALAPPKPVAAPLPTPKTVATDAARAETSTPPSSPAPAPPIGPSAPLQPAPAPSQLAPPAAPKVIATDGIPTDYVNQVYTRINRNADYPREAKLRRQQGRVGYKLTLSQSGALLHVEIDSSGNDSFDQAAREAIGRAAPFPALPELGGSTYLLAGNIIFKLN